jgi:diguanylate cyclase (GGDEF)-like protein/PAS domain S-box-containing protein
MLGVCLLIANTWTLVNDASVAVRRVAHTHVVLNHLAHIRSQTIQIELSTQGFRISGDLARLAERDATIAAREAVMSALHVEIANDAIQLTHWHALREVLDQRLRISRQVEELRKTQGTAAANAYVATAPLQATRDRAHGLLNDMETQERALLAQRTERQGTTGQRVFWSGVVLSGLLLVWFVLTYVMMRRQWHRLDDSRRALAESENSLSTTLHSIGDGVIATDTTGRITRMNPVAEQLTGWPLDLVRGHQVGEVFIMLNEHTRQPAEMPVARVLATGVVHELANHTLLLQRDGTECPIADSAAPIRDASGQVRGVVIVFRDETLAREARQTIAAQNTLLEQRVQERTQALQESQEHLVNVMNSVPALIAYVDAQQHYVYVNAQYHTRFAAGKDSIIGLSVREVLGEDRYRIAAPMIAKVLQGQPQHYDWEPFPDVWQLIHYLPKLNAQGVAMGYYVLGTDVTEHKHHERELIRVANYDSLTQLPNRRLLSDRLNQAILYSDRSRKLSAICFLDLDGFKTINDQHGHEVGDELLVGVARQLTAVLRAHDTLARLGGDEFVLLLSDLVSPTECAHILDRVLQTVRQPVNASGHVISITASIGVTLYPHDNADPDTLLRHADQTMYLAKQAGKNRYQLFDPDIDRNTRSRRELLEQMRTGLEQGEFVLFYQPKVDLSNGDVVGFEALIRWQHPQRGLLPPSEFLPHMNGSELEQPLGEWVMEAVLCQMEAWASAGRVMKVSINVSASHLLHPLFHERLAQALSRHPGIAASDLELEVLETAAIADMQQAQDIMQRCMALGVRFSLDDFGTGYSSLTYLRKLPVHTLKIDQSFVRDMLVDPEDLSIVQGVIQLASAFHRQVIAEGVETMALGTRLRDMGCRFAQGYGIAHPMPADQVVDWCAQWLASGAWR